MSVADIIPEYRVRRNSIDVQGLNEGAGNGSGNGREMTPLASKASTIPILSPRRLKALNCLLSKADKETMAECAARAGCSARTLFSYMADTTFYNEYRRLCNELYKASHIEVTKAHIKGCLRHGPAQAQLIKLYYDRVGDPIVEHSENVNTNRADPFNIDDLSIGIKRAVVDELDAVARGEDVRYWTYQLVKGVGPQPMLPQATRNVTPITPLDEVELRQDAPSCD